jgi:hypothetical protein
MVAQDGKAHPSAPPDELSADRSRMRADRFERLPPAVPISAAVVVVAAVPTVPLGPEGAWGGDGD